ncbi:helix-turn-helix domain-containing protein [Nocardiopsis synnemataformans]|uniref:helix-turn-helix domain-containing protein n=1 Tax=Nocardiopsis synnemataformans TaxID=61305 RepID=UPI003EB83F91
MPQRFNAEKARRRRYELGLTLAALADLAGVSVSHLSQIENELYQPSPTTFAPIARALELDAEELWISSEEGDAA